MGQTELPVYMRSAEQAQRLRELGMSGRAIARALDVSDKTVAKPSAPQPLSLGSQ
jgi:transposase